MQRDTSAPAEERQGRSLNKSCMSTCIPKRYVVALLSFFGFLNVYSLRVNLSVALVAMVNNKTDTDTTGAKVIVEEAEFNWDTKTQGLILSSFFYGYIFTQIPGGYLAGLFGGVKLFGGGILMTALFTLITPYAARSHVYLLVAVRILEGVFEGVTFPCIHAIWSKWAPPLERSKLVTISLSGPFAGTVLGMTLSGLIAHNHGWAAIFYFFGTLAIIWCLFWFALVTDLPENQPGITDSELTYIKSALVHDTAEIEVGGPPWRKIFTSLPVYAIIVAHTSENWGYYTLLTSLPTYLKSVLHFDLKDAGFLSALPYLVMVIVVQGGGQLADFFRRKEIMGTTTVRKVFNSIGFIAQAVFMVVVGYTTSHAFAVAGLTLAVGLGGIAWSGFPVNHLDIAPRYASLLFGISNCIATLPGIISPLLVGFVTQHESQSEWRIIFYVSASIYVAGMIFYILFASGEKQPWANGDVSGTETNHLLKETEEGDDVAFEDEKPEK